MTHFRGTESLISGSVGQERNGKCVVVYLVLDKYYEMLSSLHMARTSSYNLASIHMSQKCVKNLHKLHE